LHTTTTRYDPDGNVYQVNQPTGTTTVNTYDLADQLVTSETDGATTTLGYDAAGQVRSETPPGVAGPVTRALDLQGREVGLSEAISGTTPGTSATGYNANDLPMTWTVPGGTGGVRESVQYDANNNVTQVTATGPGGASGNATRALARTAQSAAYNPQAVTNPTLNSTYAYHRDSAQRIDRLTTISGTDTLGYNAQGRLASDCGPQVVAVGGCYTYQYDGNGNSTVGVNRDGHLNHGVYNTLNELVQGYTESYPATATVSYGYDAAGDTTAITTPVGLTNPTDPHALNTHFTYNPQGWLTAATYLSKGALVTLTQAYNAQGQRSRYSLSSNGAPALDTLFTYDSNGRVSQETVITNTATGPKLVFDNLYLYTQDGRPWMFLHTDPTTTPSTVPYGFVLDGQGNVVAVTDQGGAVVDRYAYNQWGRETGNDAADEEVPQQLRYRGLYYDEQPARYWMSDHRAYDPALERYLQPDANRSYVYADDNPTGACSLSGQCEILLHRDSVVPPIKLPCDVTLPIGPGLPVPLPTCGTYIAFYHLYLTVRQGQTVWIFQGNPSYYQEQKVFGKKVPLGGGLLIADGSSTKPLSKGINDDQYTNRGKQRTTVSHIPTNGRSCKQYVQRFGQIGDNVTSQLLYYAFYTNNSNSVAWTYLKYAGLYSPPLSVANYPGWGVDVSSGR
jgi:RHS repeat-associated protein